MHVLFAHFDRADIRLNPILDSCNRLLLILEFRNSDEDSVSSRFDSSIAKKAAAAYSIDRFVGSTDVVTATRCPRSWRADEPPAACIIRWAARRTPRR